MKRNLFRASLFLLLLLAGLSLLSLLFWPKGNTREDGIQSPALYAFLGEPENSLDVVVVGDSIPLSSFIPPYLWQDFGITSYVCADTAQKSCDAYRLLQTFFRSQSPKVVLYEADQLYLELTAAELLTSEARRTLPVFQYHDNWKFVSPKQMLPSPQYLNTTPEKGYHLRKTTLRPDSIPEPDLTDTALEPISQANLLLLKRTARLCREQGAAFVLYSAPNLTGWSIRRHNALAAAAEELGIPYLDGNLECTDINWNNDTLDAGEHLNAAGAIRVTKWLGAHLENMGPYPDHEDVAEAWQKDFAAFDAMVWDPDLYW